MAATPVEGSPVDLAARRSRTVDQPPGAPALEVILEEGRACKLHDLDPMLGPQTEAGGW